MATVVNKTADPVVVKMSANTPDYPTADWLINPDLSALSAIPQKHWKVSGSTVVEMTQAEKDVVDYGDLAARKVTKNAAIDANTMVLIAGGFTYDSTTFSLSEYAQINWTVLKTLESLFTWPVDISTKADGEYSLTQANLDAFLDAGRLAVQGPMDSGRALKLSVNAAADQAALDAVVDTR